MSYHLTPVRTRIIKKQKVSVGKDVEKREPLCTAGGNALWKSVEVPQNVENRTKKDHLFRSLLAWFVVFSNSFEYISGKMCILYVSSNYMIQ